MKWPAFAYARVDSLDALWRTQAQAGPDARVIAGGQGLLAALGFRLSAPSALIDIRHIDALSGIGQNGDTLRIGALTTHTELGRSTLVRQHAPLLSRAVPLIAHPAIRNRGTIGGNLAYADPASELPACLIALDAQIVAVSQRGERRVAAADFFLGLFETALKDGEIIAAIEVPPARTGAVSGIDEVARRSGDYAMAGLSAALRIEAGRISDARLVYFGVGEKPVLAETASAALCAAPLENGLPTAEISLAIDLSPSGDQHSSAAMKLHLARVLTRRLVTRLVQEARA